MTQKLTPLPSSQQVSKIKERVEEKEGIPPVQQRLIFGGKQMYVTVQSRTAPGPSKNKTLNECMHAQAVLRTPRFPAPPCPALLPN